MRTVFSFCTAFALAVNVVALFIDNAKADKTINRIKLLQRSAQEEALLGHVIQTTQASSDMDCLVECSREKRCLSFNFKDKRVDGIPVCELNNQTRETKPKSIVPKEGFYYYGPETSCSSNRCLHGGTCNQDLDNLARRYKCHCLPGFIGHHCQNIATDFDIKFPKRGKTDYVMLNKMPYQLNKFTASLFVNLTQDGDHTFVSYATPDYTNAIFIHLRASKIRLWVNNIHRSFNSLNIRADGSWHHLAMAWENVRGKVSVYIDGVAKVSVLSVAVGKTVQPNGKFVLGNDQDRYGSGFVASDALHGSITRVNLWNTILSPDDIASLARECGNEVGTAVAWRDFREGTPGVSYHGEARYIVPSLCKIP